MPQKLTELLVQILTARLTQVLSRIAMAAATGVGVDRLRADQTVQMLVAGIVATVLFAFDLLVHSKRMENVRRVVGDLYEEAKAIGEPALDLKKIVPAVLLGSMLLGLGGCALLAPQNGGQPATPQQKLRQAETLFQATLTTLNQLDKAGKIDPQLKEQLTPYVKAAYDALVAYRAAVAANASDEDAQYQAFLAALKRLGGSEAFTDPPATAPAAP